MEISRDGHRARMRAAYLQGGGDAMPDHQLLELLLSISIPARCKPIAYALINRFGSLEQVFAAGAADLQQVPGVGEQTAVQILLVRDLNRRIRQNQNKPVKHLTDATVLRLLCQSVAGQNRRAGVLGHSGRQCQNPANPRRRQQQRQPGRCGSAHFDGTYSARQRQRCYAGTQPSGGKAQPSAQDLEFTIRLLSILRSIHVQLLDHIIVEVLPTPTPCAATRSTAASSPSNNAMYKRNRSLAPRFPFFIVTSICTFSTAVGSSPPAVKTAHCQRPAPAPAVLCCPYPVYERRKRQRAPGDP